MKIQKKKKIIKPFALKCPVCNGRGEVRAHLYQDDPLGIDMTYVTCRSCKGNGFIVIYTAEVTESQPSITTKTKTKEDSFWSTTATTTTATQINSCSNCIYACPTLSNNPTMRHCFLRSRQYPASYFCKDWSYKSND